MLIPRVIHYVWVGPKKMPRLAERCISSWKKFLPDYEIIEWNEHNFDINCSQYCREAYEAGKYAFVSDYIRIAVLYKYGGIYMDTDVEVLQPLSEEILACDGFSGYETPRTIPTGIMGCVPGQAMFKAILEYYDSTPFIKEDGTYNVVTNVEIITNIAIKHGFLPDGSKKTVLGFTLFPQTYFCPLSHDTDETYFSKYTYTIHHFSGSWCDNKTRFVNVWNHRVKKKCVKIVGKRLTDLIYRIVYHFCILLDLYFIH